MLSYVRRSILAAASSLGLTLLAPLPCAAQSDVPTHFTWAVDIASHVTPSQNEYSSNPSYISWAGVGGATQYTNRTLCGSFVTLVLKQAYGYTDTYFRGWFGSTSPTSAGYHDAIVAENRFVVVPSIFDLAAGDILAIKYPSGSSVTGHVGIAASTATLKVPTNPLISGTYQFEVTIVDSSSSGHGSTDTRLQPDGTWKPGAGIGVMRFYTDGVGTIVGHTWSTTGSGFYNQSTRHVVIGRFP